MDVRDRVVVVTGGGQGIGRALCERFAAAGAAARLVPAMTGRGGGYFLQVLSAAGLITGPSGLSYTVTKHAGVGFAEWLVINHGRDGIGVSCLCPTAVATPHFLASQAAAGGSDAGIMRNIGLLQTPQEVADAAIEGLAGEHFLILPNPRVGASFLHKAGDYDRWLAHTRDRVASLKATDSH